MQRQQNAGKPAPYSGRTPEKSHGLVPVYRTSSPETMEGVEGTMCLPHLGLKSAYFTEVFRIMYVSEKNLSLYRFVLQMKNQVARQIEDR